MIIPARLVFILFLMLVLFQSRSAQFPEQEETTLYAVGDVMLGRYIAKVMAVQGGDFPLREIAPILHRGDIVFGNLESVVSSSTVSPSYPDKPYNFHASPGAAQALKNAGFHVLSLANNHAMDYGPAALSETRGLLSRNGLAFFGAGKNISEARKPVIITSHGTRFGFLGCGAAHSRKVYAKKNSAGIAPIEMDNIRKDLQSLRKQCDILIVSLHWGMEYENMPSQNQRKDAHQIIDWGADMILGHHPHVLQGIEVYKQKVIAYSLGNFLFDAKDNGANRSILLACKFRGKTLYSAEIVPLDRFKAYFPRIAAGTSKKGILEELKRISLPLNAQMPKLFGTGTISPMEEISK